MTLDLFGWSAPDERDTKPENARPSIAERFASWSAGNGHVLAEMLRLAREQLDRGATFVSTKALWEACRVSLGAGKDSGYKLNNDFTAPDSRWLLDQEPRLVGVIQLRQRRA